MFAASGWMEVFEDAGRATHVVATSIKRICFRSSAPDWDSGEDDVSAPRRPLRRVIHSLSALS